MAAIRQVIDRRNRIWASCFCCLCRLHQIDTVASVPTILQAVGVVAVAVT